MTTNISKLLKMCFLSTKENNFNCGWTIEVNKFKNDLKTILFCPLHKKKQTNSKCECTL